MKIKRFLYCFLALSLSLTAYIGGASLIKATVVQNLLTYNEVDAGSDLIVSSDSISLHLERSDRAMVYKYFGVDYFSEDFLVNFEWEVATSVDASEYGLMLISNTVGSERQSMFDPKFASVSIHMQNTSIPDEVRVVLNEVDSSLNVYTSASYLVMPEGTNYYFTLLRDDDAGAFGKLTLNRYNDEERQNLCGSIYIDLHEKQDFDYLHPVTSYNGSGAYTTTGTIENVELDVDVGLVPDVVTYTALNNSNPQGAYLMGWATTNWGAITEAGFDIGVGSGNYTSEYLATGSIINDFSVLIPAANLTLGVTYGIRAFASNAYGEGYGNEVGFTYTGGDALTIFVGNALVTETISGNFTASFIAWLSNPISDNVTARMSTDYANWTDPIPLYLLYASEGEYTFDTWNGTASSTGTLLPDTTYYYQGIAEYNDILHYSAIKSLTTTAVLIPIKPTVEISRLRDISEDYKETYVLEITGKINTSNTTALVTNQGIQLSEGVSPSGAILPPYYEVFASTVLPDNTFVLTLTFDNAEWFEGQTLYFRAFIDTSYYGLLYSTVVPFTFADSGGVGGVGGIDDDEVPDTIQSFSDIISQVRASMHLYGVMGTWAFMGLAILLVSLVYGIGMIAVGEGIARVAVAVAWLLTTVAIVGAFIFTGQLGIWPLIILVGGVVVLVLIVLSVKLSGGGQNG